MLLQACKNTAYFFKHGIIFCAAVCKSYQKKHVLRIGKLHGNSCLAQGIAGFRTAVTPRRRINRYFGAVKPGYGVFAGAACIQKFQPGKFT